MEMIQGSLSLATLRATFNTLFNQAGRGVFMYSPYGFRLPFSIEAKLQSLGSYHRAFAQIIKYENQGNKAALQKKEDHYSYVYLKRILRFCREKNIRLAMFISPTHAWRMEEMRLKGQWQDFENWKRRLVQAVEEESGEIGGVSPYTIWDFSGYNSITTEPVPSANDTSARMHGYWEVSHYKKEVGDIILRKILAEADVGTPSPSDFGTMISTSGIDAHLDNIRKAQANYIASHASDVSEIACLLGKKSVEECRFTK
jgi:hypothetical protein